MHEGITTGDKLTESQADHFSSALLVPRLSFIKEFPRIRGKQFDWNALVEFKLRWKISLKMCIYRASALGLLTQEQARTGYMHLNSEGIRELNTVMNFCALKNPACWPRRLKCWMMQPG